MVSEHLEIERKYDVDGGYTLPPSGELAALPGVAAVDEPVEHLLSAGYFDTADLRLFRGRVTLRRRTGGPDAGWHLKLPAEGGGRREVHAPLGRSAKKPPAAGENAFAYGRLHALEEFRAERARAAFDALVPSLRPTLRSATKKR